MKVAIHTDGFEGARKRSLTVARKLDRGERIKPRVGITFDSPLDMLGFLTAARVRLCEVARQEPSSISALAAKLDRDPASVRRDVKKLESIGVLRTREQVNPGHGRVKIVEPVAKRFELRASF